LTVILSLLAMTLSAIGVTAAHVASITVKGNTDTVADGKAAPRAELLRILREL
jgi:hypothetical protein